MRQVQTVPDPAAILKGTDRGLSLPMHAPSELPTLDFDEVEARTPVRRRSWLQRLFGRRERELATEDAAS
jgi:hypothetical protein